MEIIPVDSHITAIDHDLLGMPGVGVCYVVRGEEVALIETGAALTAPATLAGLEKLGIKREDVGHILCTHIHVDHAGGAGILAQALPRAHVYINRDMIPHLVDPSRLIASSRRAIGELAWPLHGEMQPVPEDRIRPSDNLHLDLGQDVILDAIATHGHSPDHTSYWDRRSGGLFIGDAAGLRMDRYNLLLPVTPPPTYDLDAQLATMAMLRKQPISRLYVTHYGVHDDVDDTLRRGQERLNELIELVEAAIKQGNDDVLALAAKWTPFPAGTPGALVASCWSEMSVAGLMRFLKKRMQG